VTVLQSRPGPSDDDIEFDNDMAYLRDLAAAVFADLNTPAPVGRWIDQLTYLQAEVIKAVNR